MYTNESYHYAIYTETNYPINYFQPSINDYCSQYTYVISVLILIIRQ